jgi:hypothetical protein
MDMILIYGVYRKVENLPNRESFSSPKVSIGQKFGITQLGCTMNEKFHIWKLDKFIDKVSSEGLRDRAHNVAC